MSEILNIEHNIKPMVLKALNKATSVPKAAQLLGVSPRTVHRYKNDYCIVYNVKTNRYEFKTQPQG